MQSQIENHVFEKRLLLGDNVGVDLVICCLDIVPMSVIREIAKENLNAAAFTSKLV